VETGTTERLFRHRQTKEAETDTSGLTFTAPHSYSTPFRCADGTPAAISLDPVNGAHSDLWAPLEDEFSSVVAALDLRRLMPPLRPAYRCLAPIRPDIAATAGLGHDVGMFCGVHDSAGG
jgi:hypothetical protein